MTETRFTEVLSIFCRQKREAADRLNSHDKEARLEAIGELAKRCSKLEPLSFVDEKPLFAYLTKVYSGLVQDQRAADARRLARLSARAGYEIGSAAVWTIEEDWLDRLDAKRTEILELLRIKGKCQLKLVDQINLEVFLWRFVGGFEFREIAERMSEVYDCVDQVYEVDARSDDIRRLNRVSSKAVRARSISCACMLRHYQIFADGQGGVM